MGQPRPPPKGAWPCSTYTHDLTKNDQILRRNTYGEGRVLGVGHSTILCVTQMRRAVCQR